MSTIAFTVCFAVWTIFSIIGVQIKNDLGLNDTQFGLLVGTPILTGSLIRLMLGIWTDQYGGRIVYTAVMLSAAVATWLLTFAYDYPTFLLAALGVGIAGGSFAVGIAYVSRWYPTEKQGTALGIFGAGNVGAAVTKFLAAFIMVAYGWQTVANIWALAIAIMGVVFWFATKDDPHLEARRKAGLKPEPVSAMLFLGPLVGALSRSMTGWVADKYGGAHVAFWVFVGMAVGVAGVLYFLSIGSWSGFFAMFLVLFFVSGVGNASTFQMIPAIMRTEMDRLIPKADAVTRGRQADKESAAIIGFTSAIAAYGAFFIPKSYGTSISLTGGAEAALWFFLAFYASCIAVTWWFYTRPGGLLHDIERRPTRRGPAAQQAQ
ncbi:MAG: MFS transporter [Hyphomicrobiaceae bacterium]